MVKEDLKWLENGQIVVKKWSKCGQNMVKNVQIFDHVVYERSLLASAVDLFVILESSITSGGDYKPFYFYKALTEFEYLQKYRNKILYLQLDTIPQNYIEDGWLAEAYIRNFMSTTALDRIQNLQDSDLFLSFDADEIPKLEVLEFLKVHHLKQNVFLLNLKWSVYAFYWEKEEKFNPIMAGSTVQYLKDRCKVTNINHRVSQISKFFSSFVRNKSFLRRSQIR